jgi:uncharacterized protein
MTRHTNALAGAASPYLRQHAHQRVAWQPWGETAFAAARERDVPVLVSVGYAACHWCHVMSHESFDDPDIAELMNANFVNVKVDREERPDVDAVYMGAVQALTGSGGWPMTVVTTPDGRPWFAGTYFPPDDRFGRPGFRRLLQALAQTWRERRDEVVRSAAEITERLGQLTEPLAGPVPGDDAAVAALAALRRSFDERHGGFDAAPKFPPHTTLRWLLERPPGDGGAPDAWTMVHQTLRRMTDGGIHDQVLGGFARYAVDERWVVPHFEKMLYDNALLLPLLARAGARAGDERLREAARGVVRWALDAMRPDGLTFAASQDADSEGEEGRFATFTPPELDAALSDPSDRALAAALFGIDEVGQLEGRSVPVWRGLDVPEVVAALGADALDPQRVAARVSAVREALAAVRRRRVPPDMDDKVVTSWNALMVRGLVEAAPWLPRPLAAEAREAAIACADALWARAWDGNGLRHLAPAPAVPGAVGPPTAAVFLEDAAAYGLAALALHRAVGAARFLERALTLANVVERDFADATGGFYTTPHAGERLIVRPRSRFDGPTPSEYGLAAELLAWVAAWTDDAGRAERARQALRGVEPLAGRAPTAVASLLGVRERLARGPLEVIVAGPPADPVTAALRELADRDAPDHALVGQVPHGSAELVARIPWFASRDTARPTVYVCHAGTCQLPCHDPPSLARQLAEARAAGRGAPRP